MKRSKSALAMALASVFAATWSYAQAPQRTPYQPSAYEYGHYDYYTQPETPPAPPPATNGQVAPAPMAYANGCTDTGCTATSPCDSCGNGCKKHHCLPLFKIHECCPLECEDQETCRIFDDCCCLKNNGLAIFGWLDGGIVGTDRAPADRFNGPVTFPDRNGEGQLNQAYLVMERTRPEDASGLFIGGRVDYMYGSDYYFTTAAGLDGTPNGNVPRWDNNNFLYGSAMPQLYVTTEFEDLSIKWGHFYTIIGYEVVPAVGNFFYTHAYTMQYGEPFTHTGMLASYALNEQWNLFGGVTNGWDTFNTDTRANFLGGVTYSQDDWGSLAFALTTGDIGLGGPGVAPFSNTTMYSIVWSRNLTSRWTYILQHDYGWQDRDPLGQGDADWYGVNQYAFYRINCNWTAGARVEWFRDDDGVRVTGLRPGNAIAGASFPGNFYEVTLGLNWKPNANFILRPEVRWDWYDGASPTPGIAGPYNAGTANNQFLYGFDIIYQF